MLLGEQGGGDEDGGLHPLLDGLERGPDGHLGLAEADVAADQAVHGAVGLHVVLHVLDGLELVGRLLVGEGVLQLPLPGGVGGEGVARGGDPLAVEGHQFLGDVTDGDPNLRLGAPPLGATQPVEGGRVAAGVVADGVDLVGRDVELVAPPVLEQEVVALGPAQGLLDHAAVLADAVLVVDDVIARAEVVEEALGVGASRAGCPVGPAPAGDVALDEDGQLDLGEDEAPLEGLDHDPAGPGFAQDAGLHQGEGDAPLPQQAGHAGGRALALGGHHQLVALAHKVGHLAGEAVGVAHDRVPAPGLDSDDVGALGRAGDGPRRGGGVGQEAIEGEVEAGPLRFLPVGLGRAPGGGQAGGQRRLLVEQVGGPVAHPAGLDQKDEGVGSEQVEEGVVAGGEPRQPRLHALEDGALGQPLPLLPAPRLGTHQLGRPGPDLVGGQQLPAGEELHALHGVGGALVGDREAGEAVDLVAPKVDAHRVIGGGREHVDDRPPAGDLAPVLDLRLPAVADVDQALDQVEGVDLVAGLDRDRLHVLHVGAEALDEGPHRRHQHPGHAIWVAEAPHGPEAAAHGLGAGADPFEGERLPGGDHVDLVGAEERPQIVGQTLGVGTGGDGHHQGMAPGEPGQAGDGEGPGRLGHRQHRRRHPRQPGQAGMPAQQRREVGESHPTRVPAPSALSGRAREGTGAHFKSPVEAAWSPPPAAGAVARRRD